MKSERRGGGGGGGGIESGGGGAADIEGDGSDGGGPQRVERRQRISGFLVAEALLAKLLERRVRCRTPRLLLLRLAPADVGVKVVGAAGRRMADKTQGIVERRGNLRRVQRVDESATASTKAQGHSGKGIFGSDAAIKKIGV